LNDDQQDEAGELKGHETVAEALSNTASTAELALLMVIDVDQECTFDSVLTLPVPAGMTVDELAVWRAAAIVLEGGVQVAKDTFDSNGVLFFIGTRGGACDYTNPHKSGEVVARLSSTFAMFEGDTRCSEPSRFVEHSPSAGSRRNMTASQDGQWMSVDLGEGRSLVLNHYCLRHGERNGEHRLKSWRLEGSNDGNVWMALSEHQDDLSLANYGYSIAAWEVAGIEEAYRHFRVFGVHNSDRSWGVHCAGMELYGQLRGAKF
jgi:hypothetical protein